MKVLRNKKILTVAVLVVLGLLLAHFTTSEKQVDYSADVKPILNKKCISCHGGVKAKSGFSVLFREEALAKTESGKYGIVPGKPGESEMIRRINETDPEERMPYKHEPLSKEEISILTRWVKQGAKWGDHWAYVPVKPVEVPDVESKWIGNDVDRFIFQKLEEHDLQPSAEADKSTLLRRVSLDLTGMYPDDAVAKKFLSSKDPKAYEELVDSLISSKHFGERWASVWLDIARYADSKGYESDLGRNIWQYRDWVIRAFNEDKPYNEFLTEQIAGDLHPDPSDEQFIATAFHRNSMTNDEGGTDNEEFRVSAVMDRVNTTWEGIMGTTFSCVQCHSHPYDPFRHEEYYSFLAYFNNTRDEDQYPEEYPYFRSYTDQQQEQVEKLTGWVQQQSTAQDAAAVKKFLRTWQPAIYASTADSIRNGFVSENNGALRLHNQSVFRLKQVDLSNAEQVMMYYASDEGGSFTVRMDSPDGPVIAQHRFPARKMIDLVSFPIRSDGKVHDLYFSITNTALRANWTHLVYMQWLAFNKTFPGKGEPGYEVNKKIFDSLLTAKVETVPVLVENPAGMKRKTFVFERGSRITPGKEVQPGVPGSLSAAMPANAPKNRAGLAMWLTDKKNPLVSRTMVNRVWEQIFGAGIVETLEDMGTQGSLPTHKEMLDHYAWKFMNDYKWSVKKLAKEFVMSSAYRQDSKTNDELKEKDPFNVFYARGPRVRLHAEQLRDQHLSISGVMSTKMYGPGVMPWQPEGIWSNPYNADNWKVSEGEDRYRRSLYTYIKRTGAYPSLISFDATSRIVCTPRRIRTNTPLQALVTLNDSAYVDMAAHFAKRMMREGGKNIQHQIARGYEIMTYKKIPAEKQQILEGLYTQAITEYQNSDSSAVKFTGLNKGDTGSTEMAALKVVANAMLNLEEVITKN